jgi:hypothetical protein
MRIIAETAKFLGLGYFLPRTFNLGREKLPNLDPDLF